MKKIKFLILILILISIFSVTLKASESVNKENESVQHETGTPLIYNLNWVGLIVMFVIVFGELRSNKSKKKHQEDKKAHEFYEAGSEKPDDLEHKAQKPFLKPVLLILITGLIYSCEQLPVLANFHENSAIGYFRFIFKIIVGILMLSYGLSSMEEEHH